MDHRYLRIDQEVEREELQVTHPTDLVKRRHHVLRVTTHVRSITTISSLMACTLSRVLKKSFAKTLACHAELLLYATLEPYGMSIDAFSFSSFFRKAGIFIRSSGDWRYSPMACAADVVGAAMAKAAK